jgi:DNA-binding response OmpR family regulator
MKLLIVEDEIELAEDIIKYFSSESYTCTLAKNYQEAKEKISLYQYDCIILDLMLPNGKDGLTLLQYLTDSKQGLIIISAKNSLEDKIKGLTLGADDYLAKPFHMAELAARVFSVIRRKQFGHDNIIKFNELDVDLLAKNVKVNGVEIFLTKKEYSLLLLFLGNKNRVISKNALAEHLSGDISDMFDNQDFVYAHIKNLKKKLNDANCNSYLKTIYGTGYKWQE